MANTTYDSSNIKVMDEIEHIRTNPGMYIGSTEDPTHLIEEVLDNALDECQGGHADIIGVIIDTKENSFCVVDNGRGIPIDNDVPITIATKLFSGGKFKGSKTAYDIASGLHGVGLVAVNALCSKFVIEVVRDSKFAHYTFEKSKFIVKDLKAHSGRKPFSTRITFTPDKKVFENLKPNIERIRSRLLVASVNFENATFVLQVDGVKDVIKITKDEFFNNHVLNENDKDRTPIFKFSVTDAPEKFDVWFAYSFTGTIAPRITSSVNLLPVDGGGTHVNIFQDILKNTIMTKGKKHGANFLPQDTFCGLRAYISMALKEPEFSGQTKYKLDNRRSHLDGLANKLKNAIDKWAIDEDKVLAAIVEHFNSYRKKLNSKKLKSTTAGRRGSTKFTKLRDCINPGGELFIVEGDSAGGSFIECRNPSKHAIFPLRGKIPSVANKKDILKNEEVKELIHTFGTGVEGSFNINNLRYNKIICATDADEDGYHIFCLLTIMLATLVPEIIKQGRFYLGMAPLYAIVEKNEFTPLWSEEELDKARKNNNHIQRYKGLGEMSSWQLKKALIDPKTRNLIKVDYSKNLAELLKLFESAEKKRELLQLNMGI